MNSLEVGQLLNYVNAAYPQFIKDNDPKIIKELWCDALAPYKFDDVKKVFMQYAQVNEFPPKIASLVKNLSVKDESYNVPGLQETKQIIAQYKPLPKSQRPTPEQIKKMIAEKLGKDYLK